MASRLLSRFSTLAKAANKNSLNGTVPLFTKAKKQAHHNAISNAFLNASATKAFSASSLALGTALPIYIFAPSFAYFIDPVVALTIPVHMYIGVGYVIDDYVPVALKPVARFLWLIICLLASWGLLNTALTYGLGNIVKSLWLPAGSIYESGRKTEQ